ncbi:MAG: hypothetical protein JNL87_16635 [Burkholderiaceae bacterium]|nr:hypothetical protein [Burkholderiaceae bacterium]
MARVIIDNDFAGEPDAAQTIFNDSDVPIRQVSFDASGQFPFPEAEVCVLGDGPLVTFTAPLRPCPPEPSSSHDRLTPMPQLQADGRDVERLGTRPLQVYTQVGAQPTFRDMLAKFRRVGGLP